ncbi:hypothetical protein MKW94_013868 [Papaver nudicaule]|uniref:Uncharacterized protein n=1 Tax=Papaver nudicaule TaxID=74823 RepID=A0AA41V4M0_PAPNU|nr:hypothetical protein [Papaver nudicaule]
MAKISVVFLCFFLFVLIANPVSSSSRMLLQKDRCPDYDGTLVCVQECAPNTSACPIGQKQLLADGCGCTKCCPI